MQNLFKQVMQGISLESNSQQTIRLLEQQRQQFLQNSQHQAAKIVASALGQLKDNFLKQDLAVDPNDETISRTVDNLQNDPDLASDSFNLMLATVLEMVSKDLYPQDSASLKALLADFVLISNLIETPHLCTKNSNINVGTFIHQLKHIMEISAQSGCLARVLEEYSAGEQHFEHIETAVRSGEPLWKYTFRGLDKFFYNSFVSQYSTSEALQNDLNQGTFIKKIKSLEMITNPLFIKLNDYLLDYSKLKPSACISNRLLTIHLPRGTRNPASKVILDNIDLLEKYYAISLTDYMKHEDIYGDTLLHKAVNTRNPVLVKLLLDNGINPTQPNHQGYSPYALAYNNYEIKALLTPAASDKPLTQAVNSALFEEKPLLAGGTSTLPQVILDIKPAILSNSAA